MTLRQITRLFGYLTPAFVAALGCGFLYDTPVLGTGMKVGMGVCLCINAFVFCLICLKDIEDGKYG
jgi:hypothetical protein